MCFHRRLVFACSHHAWLGLTRPCELEQSFDRGDVDTGCSARWSHGFDTVRMQAKCPRCTKTQEGHRFRFGIVKDQIAVLKEHLRLIKGASEIKEREWLHMDSAVQDDAKSDGTEEEGADASSSGETGDTSVEGGVECLDEAMEEVRVDPKHETLRLPQIVAARTARAAGVAAVAEQPARSE
ncbi:hypothetical protein C8A01DRAFT_39517 [Parachaetomium inaequale]|uniref:Uncharacterized protein n=1 Tax=Parachaetomium inaequale TaxID=2588326 RepID=A0AAN6P935_9PEZI|nr:hypothetical protein C8A01DRAFT_39517 [Parachaetomium inaequale]